MSEDIRICTWCKTPVASFEKYQNHIDENHLEILIKKCYFCEFESRQRLEVHNHIFAKHSLKPILPSHFCEYCLEFRATSSDVINFHIEKCPAKLIMRHDKDDDDSNFRILKDKSSPLKIVLSKEQQQLADSGGNRPQHDEIVFNCHLCAYKTEDKVDFGSHLIQHFDNKCVICNNTFMTAELLDQHITEQHGSFVQIIKHEEIDSSDHLATDNAGLRNVVEEKLTEESPRKPSRRTTKAENHKKTNMSQQRSKINDKNKYIPIQILNRLNGKFCTECQYVGSVRFETIQHIQNIHLKTKLFQCNLCNFESLKLRVLKKHFENSHLKKDKSKTVDEDNRTLAVPQDDYHSIGISYFDDPNEIVEVPFTPRHVPEIVNLEIDQPQKLPTISKNIQKKRQIRSNKNNSKRNIFLKSQEFSRKKQGRNRDNTQIIKTDDEEKIRNPGKRKFAPNSNELTYSGEVKKSLNNQRKSDELVVPEASKDHCPQNNSKITESTSQDIDIVQHKCVFCQRSVKSSLYKKHIKACNEASKHVSDNKKSCKICQKTFQKLSEIYIHILEKHSQSLEVENVVDDGIISANEDTIQIPNTSTKAIVDKPKKRSIRPPSRFQNYEMMSSFCFEENSTEKTPLESSKKASQNNSKSAQKEVGFVISENKQNHIQDDISTVATTIVDELEHKEVEEEAATKVDKAVILDSNESQISSYDQMSKNNSETIKDEIDKIPRTTSDSKVLGFELNQNQKTKRRKKMTKKSDFCHYFDLVNVTKTSKKDGKSFISKMKPLIRNFYTCSLCTQWKTTHIKEFQKHQEMCNNAPTAKNETETEVETVAVAMEDDDSEQIYEPEPEIEEQEEDATEEMFPAIGPYQCEICQNITETKIEFVVHLKTDHPGVVDENVLRALEANNVEEEEEDIKSSVESESSGNHHSSDILEENHFNIYSCVISTRCKETFRTDHDLENHVLKDHSNHKLDREDINEMLLAKYKVEYDRLKTFKCWNYMSISPKELARAGFVNTGREDEVQCVFCAGVIGNWEEGDNPMVEHKKEFPTCSFIFNDGNNVGNIPIVKLNPQNSTSSVIEILNTNDDDDAVVIVELSDQDDEEESKSPMEIEPTDHCDDHQTDDEILEETCGYIYSCVMKGCKETFKSDHDVESHGLKDHSNHNLKRIDVNELLLAKYKAESDRLETFKGWNYLFISPEKLATTYLPCAKKLAKAGFVNTGREDYVQCVFCAGIIGNWEENDDPMVEHKKEFPKCRFIFNDGYYVGNIPIVNPNPEISTLDVNILDYDDDDQKLELKNYNREEPKLPKQDTNIIFKNEKNLKVKNDEEIFSEIDCTRNRNVEQSSLHTNILSKDTNPSFVLVQDVSTPICDERKSKANEKSSELLEKLNFDIVRKITSKCGKKSLISKLKPVIRDSYTCSLCSHWRTTNSEQFRKHIIGKKHHNNDIDERCKRKIPMEKEEQKPPHVINFSVKSSDNTEQQKTIEKEQKPLKYIVKSSDKEDASTKMGMIEIAAFNKTEEVNNDSSKAFGHSTAKSNFDFNDKTTQDIKHSNPKKQQQIPPQAVVKPQVKHKCTFCEQLVTNELYKNHMKICYEASKHIQGKKCKICQGSFKKISEVYIHFLKSHRNKIPQEEEEITATPQKTDYQNEVMKTVTAASEYFTSNAKNQCKDAAENIVLQDISTPPPPQTTLFCSADKIKNEIHLDKDDDDCKSKLEESPSNESIGHQANEFQDVKEDQVVDEEDKNIPNTTAVDLPSFFEDLIEDNKCILCSFSSDQIRTLKLHIKIGHFNNINKLVCLQCQYQAADNTDLVQHLKQEHRKNNQQNFRCLKCQNHFNSKASLKEHLRTKHALNFKCALCEFSTSSDANLVQHVSEQHNDRINLNQGVIITDYICPLCPSCEVKSFENAIELSAHLRQNHSKDLGTKCCFCDEVRSSYAATIRHIDTIHFDIRNFPCHICNHRFTCKRDVDNHLKSHERRRSAANNAPN